MNPEIVLGPPGTGKTTTLLNMVEEELAAGTQPEAIGYVSFTRRAAQEAQERARKQMDLPGSRFPWFRTLHSLCFRALGLSSSDVLEKNKLVEFGNWIGVRMTGMGNLEEGATFGFQKGDRILFMENLARVRGVSLRHQYDTDSDDQEWFEVERVARALAEYKKAQHLWDYTDMLAVFAEQEWSPPLDVLFVDEAQDLSLLQWRVVAKLARSCRRVVIAGDDDQAIYNWAGAAVDHFVDMTGRVRVLGQSWRVPRRIQSVADQIIQQVRHRRPKQWSPRDEEGSVEEGRVDDVDWTGRDILVLSRNVKQLERIRDDIHATGYMYEYRGAPSVRDSMRQAILTWERLRQGQPQMVDAVVRSYEHMSSGVGVARGYKTLPMLPRDMMVTMGDLLNSGGLLREDVWHDAFDRVPASEREYIRACLRRKEKMSERPRIRLSTIHGSKGGEADHVVLLTDMATRTHQEMERSPDDEARVWYVGVTRAKRALTIIRPRTEKCFALRA